MKIILNGDLNMRLYDIYYICKTEFENINKLQASSSANGTRKISSWPSYKIALLNLSEIDFIKEDVQKVYMVLNPIDREQSIPEIGLNTYQELLSKHNILRTKIIAVIDLYESMKDATSKPGIDIKIPNCDYLKEYMDILDDINFIFTQCPYLLNENEELKFNGTDVGSQWITFAIVSGAATTGFIILNNLASLVNKTIALMSNKKVFDMQEETYKSMQLKNEITQETINAFKKMKEITYKKYVDELQDELGTLKDGEEEGKVSKSLEKLANLIEKGVEIHTSIETPKEIKVLFPFAEPKPSLPESLLKYIEDKSTKKDDK